MFKSSMTLQTISMLVATLSLAPVSSVYAQQAKRLPRIGWLGAGFSSSEFPEKQALDGLRDLGWIDGKNVFLEFRYAQRDSQKLQRFASDLVRSKIDVIVTFSAGVAVAKKATDTIPIVMGTSQDPVRAGFVSSLARPSGNLTGITFLTDELSGKRLELLKEAMPKITQAAVVWEPAHVDNEFRGMQGVSPLLGVRLQSIEIPRPPRPDEIERAIQGARDGHSDALILAPGGFTILHRNRIIDLAIKNSLPVLSAWKIFAEQGALLTYGPEIDTARRVAYFVDRILKGAKPADLPVEQPTKFELVINLKAAKQIGLTIPPNLLARADRVIR